MKTFNKTSHGLMTMKKLFLIPLLALATSMTAWGATITVGEGGDQTSLAAAISAATAGDKLQLVSDITVPSTIQIKKNLTIDFNGYTITETANYQIEVYANLTLETTKGGGMLAPKGCLDVYGTSKITINGGTLTTNITDSGAAIWLNGSSCELEFNEGTINGASSGIVADGGRIIVNNGSITGDGCVAVQLDGEGYLEINDGTLIANSSTKYGRYGYAVINKGHAVVNGGFISGVHGGFDCSYENAVADIYGGTFETRLCTHGGAAHYALYTSNYGVVNVYGGKFKSADKRAIFCGNNDAYSVIGVVNLYGGKMATKAYVQNAPTNTFPSSIPATSQWYSSFGSDAPLPAGYAYEEITSGADYDAGYRWQVVCTTPPEKQETVASDTNLAEESMATDAVVTIGKDVEVTVEAAVPGETTEVEVAQVFVNQGASLTVKEGATLNVGEGGLNIGVGGTLVVEQGATLTVGAAGIVSAQEDVLVLKSSEANPCILLYEPTVSENTQPKATYQFATKAYTKPSGKQVWQRFGIPASDGETVITWPEGIRTRLYDFDYASNGWHQLLDNNSGSYSTSGTGVPFQCYNMTTYAAAEGTEYTLTGSLMGNQNAPLAFISGWNYYANSYTAPISLREFLSELLSSYGSQIAATAYIYRAEDDWWDAVTYPIDYYLEDIGLGSVPQKEINPMQAFILRLYSGSSADAEIDYKAHVYDPAVGASSPAPRRQQAGNSITSAMRMTLSDGNNTDKVMLIEGNLFSEGFDNGYDAVKYMNPSSLNIYAIGMNENYGTFATNNLIGTTLAVDVATNGSYTLTFDNVKDANCALKDIQTNTIIDVEAGTSYTFQATTSNHGTARFAIVSRPNAPTSIDNIADVVNQTGVYTLLGKYLGEKDILTSLPNGVYIVNGKKIVK